VPVSARQTPLAALRPVDAPKASHPPVSLRKGLWRSPSTYVADVAGRMAICPSRCRCACSVPLVPLQCGGCTARRNAILTLRSLSRSAKRLRSKTRSVISRRAAASISVCALLSVRPRSLFHFISLHFTTLLATARKGDVSCWYQAVYIRCGIVRGLTKPRINSVLSPTTAPLRGRAARIISYQ